MNTTTKAILGISVATTVGAVLGISLTPEQRSFVLSKIKIGAQDLVHDITSLFTKENAGSVQSIHKTIQSGGEMTSELIDIDQYETYNSNREI